MEHVLESVSNFIWGIPVLVLILITGIVYTVRTRFAQIRLLPMAFKHFVFSLKNSNCADQGISGYKALCTALAATVGTGNIAGVAGAISLGGPGVIFWMWVCGVLGMIIKFAEAALAVRYRNLHTDSYSGGPMYIIQNALPPKGRILSIVYCCFGIIAAFGVGNATQVNAVIESVKYISKSAGCGISSTGIFAIGIIIAVMVLFAFKDGVFSVSNWSSRLVPFACLTYVVLAVGVVLRFWKNIPDVITEIISGAFQPSAITGGIVGSFLITLRIGTSRGVFTSEAGMGTASIAHASAQTDRPIEQGLLGIIEVFLDTILMCTLTAMAILCSGIEIPFGTDTGIILTIQAFTLIYGNWGSILISLIAGVLAFATILGWGFYGMSCAQYLFGIKSQRFFVSSQVICILISVFLKTSVIWLFSEIINGLMALPNLIALLYLVPEFTTNLNSFICNKKR